MWSGILGVELLLDYWGSAGWDVGAPMSSNAALPGGRGTDLVMPARTADEMVLRVRGWASSSRRRRGCG